MVAAHAPPTPADTIVRVCLLPATAIAIGGGLQQWAQGAPAGGADADNVHRFVAGVSIGWAPLFFWAAATIHRQGVLVYFLAVPIFLGGVGRLVSFAQDGMPTPAGVFLTSALPEFAGPEQRVDLPVSSGRVDHEGDVRLIAVARRGAEQAPASESTAGS
ncbi:hypothetical protein AQI88_09770 [Streptomyces cellostaticus]|uniref:Uncharacterized protein n=1 Tax=Streptomyces cellostaticus TaxID=67285 RepID=A0A101NPH0_9ACTN|nr:DUF4345 domain-containing protein [Streptomyces cellostaticus]KUM96777.1 hypothetical protein AQI88_09770 [Streptomyces cellostaticus]GHI05809.1 hypothetical protein Scel_41300 [Streptomyces cellostaticus]